ncbi:DNA polymerase III subunit beta [Allosaccharopolyspora coralli]|uniref:DNA polymerase III subunit beta n=1 Tax=Allosaccharopolyspora coralli TaxID=2665642 RepID=A0A5Q3Q7H4_9PSEU|nr:DNA polymerase III subunit beta [Allosaccharopolyspora coralli]QGK70303.1 DNA polymerase III subunit beta [Allosaccharopolyspora coralli]
MSTATDTRPAAALLECQTDRATLTEALSTVAVGVPRRPAVPLLGGVLLESRGGHLTLTTTDIDTVVSVRIPDAVNAPGALLVDHVELSKMLGALVKGSRKREADAMPVTLRATVDGHAVLSLGGYTMPLTAYPVEEFPTLPTVPASMAEADRETFTQQARRVLIARGADATLPIFTSVHVQAAPGALTLAATDRFRLAVAEIPATTAATEDRSVMLPAELLSSVLKHCTGDRVRLGVDAASDWAALSCGDLTVLTRTVDAEFPRYERLFPETTASARADRGALAQATVRATAALEASHYTADRDQAGHHLAVTLHPDGRVSVAPVLAEHAETVTAPEHPAEVGGVAESVRVLFGARYLRDALSSLAGDTVTLRLDSPNRPVVFTATDTPGYRHLIMPVRPTS